MIIVVWPKSGLAIRTVGDFDEVEYLLGPKSDWYPDKYPHPDREVKELGEYQKVIDTAVLNELDVHDMTPHEAFSAMNGLGLPEERDCGLTAVKQLFSEKKVKGIGARQVNRQNRTIVDFVEFEDGTRMFFASSPLGPVVYRIQRPRSYVEAVT